jgi:hypothetical protein
MARKQTGSITIEIENTTYELDLTYVAGTSPSLYDPGDPAEVDIKSATFTRWDDDTEEDISGTLSDKEMEELLDKHYERLVETFEILYIY